MRRSKLELYGDIISTLTEAPLTIDEIAFKCNMNCVNVQQRLDFLVKNNISIAEISGDNRVYYVLTRRGIAVSKTLQLAKRLEKLQVSEKKADPWQSFPSVSERDEEEANPL